MIVDNSVDNVDNLGFIVDGVWMNQDLPEVMG